MERERERERNINVWLPLTWPPLGTWPCNPSMCPDWELNWRPFGLQAHVQSTELHQPGQKYLLLEQHSTMVKNMSSEAQH